MTEPGIPQNYDIQPVVMSEKAEQELNERAFLLYTGQRRLAKSALQRVLSNYICNNPSSLTAFEEMQRLAFVMVYELRRGNISNFGKMLNRHTDLFRQLDPSSSNLMLDYILQGLGVFVDGATLCGAGGGGFLYGVLKENMSLEDIRQWLDTEYSGTAIRLYRCKVVK
jgi:fucokinase